MGMEWSEGEFWIELFLVGNWLALKMEWRFIPREEILEQRFKSGVSCFALLCFAGLWLWL